MCIKKALYKNQQGGSFYQDLTNLYSTCQYITNITFINSDILALDLHSQRNALAKILC